MEVVMKKLLILLVGMMMLCSCGGKANKVVAQEFVGHNVQDVYAWCAELDDDHSCSIAYENSDEYEKDIVIDQSVQAGKKFEGEIHFNVSNGNMNEIALPYITPELSMSDIEIWKETSGLKTLNYAYETSETVDKNHVIRFDPNVHITKDTPVTVYISSGKAEPVNTDIEVKYGDYLNITVSEFESKARALGLTPNHQESRDKYDPNVKIGNIVWHGSGIYVKDEVFNYGICINAIVVSPGQYVGKSESEFIKIAQGLKLNPTHINGRDAYSAKVDKGYIVTHGNGTYVEGEEFKYGISYGPAIVQQGYEGSSESAFTDYLSMLELTGDRKTMYSNTVPAGRIISYNYGKYSSGDCVTYYVSLGQEQVYVDVPDFSGRSEGELLNFITSNGLLVGSRYEDSSLIARGNIVSNDTGRMKAGDYVSYTVSTGPAVQETAIIEAFGTVQASVSHEGDYEHAAFDMHRYLFGRGFMNYDIVPVTLFGGEPGTLVSITIDGERLGDYPVNAALNSYIRCEIVQ